jgi:hypothetical protein
LFRVPHTKYTTDRTATEVGGYTPQQSVIVRERGLKVLEADLEVVKAGLEVIEITGRVELENNAAMTNALTPGEIT